MSPDRSSRSSRFVNRTTRYSTFFREGPNRSLFLSEHRPGKVTSSTIVMAAGQFEVVIVITTNWLIFAFADIFPHHTFACGYHPRMVIQIAFTLPADYIISYHIGYYRLHFIIGKNILFINCFEENHCHFLKIKMRNCLKAREYTKTDNHFCITLLII